jgi:hypothetical protein
VNIFGVCVGVGIFVCVRLRTTYQEYFDRLAAVKVDEAGAAAAAAETAAALMQSAISCSFQNRQQILCRRPTYTPRATFG